MKKVYSLGVILIALLFGFSEHVAAQTTVTIGTGTSTSVIYGPFYRTTAASTIYQSNKTMLFTEAELNAAGIFAGATISSLKWFKTDAFNFTNGATAAVDLYARPAGNATEYTTANNVQTYLAGFGPSIGTLSFNTTTNNISGANTWVGFSGLSYIYTGGTLELYVSMTITPGSGNASGGGFSWQYGSVTDDRYAYSNANPTSSSTLTASANRPNTQLTFTSPCTTPLAGGIYTIDSAVATGGTNFQSFKAAVNTILCQGISGAVTFNATPGAAPYDQQLIITPVPGASATNTVTFNGRGNTLKFSPTSSVERAVIKLNGADYIKFDSLNIVASGTYQYGVQMMNDANNNTISNCSIVVDTVGTSSVNFAGILINSSATSTTATGASNCDSNLIVNNSILGGYTGIGLVASGATSTIKHNRVLNNTVRGFYTYGIYLNGGDSTVIEGNDISRPSRTTVTTFNGVYLTGVSVKTSISKNRIYNPFGGNPASTAAGFGIYLNSSDAPLGSENVISNNLIYGHIGSTGNRNGLLLNNSDNIKVIHNTIVLNDVSATCTNCAARGIYVQNVNVAGLEIRNNVFAISQDGDAPKQALFFEPTSVSSYNINNNNYYITSTGGSFNEVARVGGSSSTPGLGNGFSTLVAWQGFAAKDTHSVSVDPAFTGNFVPSGAFDNLGAPLGFASDIANAPRSITTPDMGAYEFSGPLCSSSITPGTVTPSSNSICLANNLLALTVTGQSQGAGQTYQWESAPSASGPWTALAPPSATPSIILNPTNTRYYRAILTCGASTATTPARQIALANALAGGQYFINGAITTGGNNFQSFGEATAALACGITGPVTFDVVPGTTPYVEQVLIPNIPGASATNFVKFNGHGAVLDYSTLTTPAFRAGFTLVSSDYVTIDSFVLNAADSAYGWGVMITDSATNNTISNCTINVSKTITTANNHNGIVITGSYTSGIGQGTNGYNNTITGNTINGGYYGIAAYGSTTANNTGNIVSNNVVNDFYLDGIHIAYNQNLLISNNDVSRPTRINSGAGSGIVFGASCLNSICESNRIHNAFGANPSSTSTFYGIEIAADGTASQPNSVINNVVYDIKKDGGTVAGIYSTTAPYCNIYHNTLILNDSTATAGTTYGFYQTGAAPGIRFVNNLIYLTRGGSGVKYGIYKGTAANALVSDTNVVFLGGTGSGVVNFGYQTSAQLLKSDWVTATGNDAASIDNVDPLFINTQSGNFIPTNFLVDNRGSAVGVVDDIVNVVRNVTTPDIGAFEFSIPACTGTPIAGSATGNLSNVCIGGTATLSLTGFTSGNGISVAWEESPAGAGTWQTIAGATNSTTNVTVTAATEYRAVVTCANGGGFDVSNTVSVNLSPFFQCYCSPLNGTTLHTSTTNYITNVAIAGTSLNVTTTSAGTGGYTQHDATVPANTTTLAQLTTYSLYAVHSSTSASINGELWIDWDGSGTFDSLEYIPVSGGTSTDTFTFSVPSTSVLGQTGMRLRSVFSTSVLFGPNGACTDISVGRETEDFLITIAPPPTCLAPSAPVASAITHNSAVATWGQSASVPANGYEWVVFPQGSGPTGTPVTSGTELAGDTVASIGGLSPVTTYTVYVRAVCSPTDASFWTASSFTTLCGPVAAPWIDSIETHTATTNSTLSNCWTSNPVGPTTSLYRWNVDASGGTPTAATTGPSGANSGSRYFYVEASSGALNATAELISPLIDLSALTYPKLEFSYHMYGVHMNKLVVSVYNGTTWNSVDSIIGQSQNSGAAAWKKKSVYLQGYSGTIQVKFTAYRGNGISGDIALDDIAVVQASSRPEPTNLLSTTNGTNTANLNWIENGGAAQWQVEYGVDSFALGTGTRTGTGSKPFVAGGLNNNTNYTYFVRSIGAIAGDTSEWSERKAMAPWNDECSTAINIGGGQAQPGTTASATQSMLPGACAATTNYANDVWYYFTTGSVGQVIVTATNTVGDVVMEVLDGTCTTTFATLGCEDSPAIGTEADTIDNLPAGVYYVRVYGFLSIENQFTVQVNGSPLAIKLLSIAAENRGTYNRVDWKSAEELKGDVFVLERSADGENFRELATIKANGYASTYSYNDQQPVQGINYYRLKMLDAAGRTEYSQVVTATATNVNLFAVDAYPNPVKETLTVSVSGDRGENASIVITDATGKLIQTVAVNANTTEIKMGGLAAGMYFVKYSDSKQRQTIKVDKQ